MQHRERHTIPPVKTSKPNYKPLLSSPVPRRHPQSCNAISTHIMGQAGPSNIKAIYKCRHACSFTHARTSKLCPGQTIECQCKRAVPGRIRQTSTNLGGGNEHLSDSEKIGQGDTSCDIDPVLATAHQPVTTTRRRLWPHWKAALTSSSSPQPSIIMRTPQGTL